jgi:hypothetical protein
MIAHRGTTQYDRTKSTTLKGTIAGFDFTNPHGEIYFEVKDDIGKGEKWHA